MNMDENTFQECLLVFGPTGGIAGPQGGVGIQGQQGLIGQGIAGNQGAMGAQGFVGAQGTEGSQGLIGQGVPGIQGSQGQQGDLGVIGTQGVQGDLGIQGDMGTAGVNGLQGVIGRQGVQGFSSALFTYGSNVISFVNGLGVVTHNLGSTPTTALLTNGDVQIGGEVQQVFSLTSTVINVSIPNFANGNRRVNWMAIK